MRRLLHGSSAEPAAQQGAEVFQDRLAADDEDPGIHDGVEGVEAKGCQVLLVTAERPYGVDEASNLRKRGGNVTRKSSWRSIRSFVTWIWQLGRLCFNLHWHVDCRGLRIQPATSASVERHQMKKQLRRGWKNCFSPLNLSPENSKSALWSLSAHGKINKHLFFFGSSMTNHFSGWQLGILESLTAVSFVFYGPKIISSSDKIRVRPNHYKTAKNKLRINKQCLITADWISSSSAQQAVRTAVKSRTECNCVSVSCICGSSACERF